jgi:hypothetical protein
MAEAIKRPGAAATALERVRRDVSEMLLDSVFRPALASTARGMFPPLTTPADR